MGSLESLSEVACILVVIRFWDTGSTAALQTVDWASILIVT